MAAESTGAKRLRDLTADFQDGVGQRLRSERERHGVSLRELARRLEISPSALSQIETGRSRPSVGTLYAIVSELDMSLDELFGSQRDRGRAARAAEPAGARGDGRHARAAPRHAQGHRARVGRALGAPDADGRAGRRLPLRRLRGRRRVEPRGDAHAPHGPRVRARALRAPARHHRVRRGARARPRATRSPSSPRARTGWRTRAPSRSRRSGSSWGARTATRASSRWTPRTRVRRARPSHVDSAWARA